MRKAMLSVWACPEAKPHSSRLARIAFLFPCLLFALGVPAQAQEIPTAPGAPGHILDRLHDSTELPARTGQAAQHEAGDAGSAYTYSVLYRFCSDGGTDCTDGEYPVGGLIRDKAGNLYGATEYGGTGAYVDLKNNLHGGTIYKVDDAGREAVLYSFCSAVNCADGSDPAGDLVQDDAGNFYGTTTGGGKIDSNCVNYSFTVSGCGTVFKFDNTGHYTVLYSFCSARECTDGNDPSAGLTRDAAGNLYGTTYGGGDHNGGTVFKLDKTGRYTVLHSFCSVIGAYGACEDGVRVLGAALIQDVVGNLYGTTAGGGARGVGNVFKLDNTGHFSVLYSFCPVEDCTDGQTPMAPLVRDSEGNLYGTTVLGGPAGWGTVFKLDDSGHESVIYGFGCISEGDFGSLCPDGASPSAGLLRDAAGDLYGTASTGGAGPDFSHGGAVFKVDSMSNYTVLYSFCTAANCPAYGAAPTAGLTQDAVGNLYSTTANGGTGAGTVFKLTATGKSATATALASAPNPSAYGELVTLTASVTARDGDKPSGTVTFKNGAKTLVTVLIAEGKATLKTSRLAVGEHSITAEYNGVADYNTSQSAVLSQRVSRAATFTSVKSSLDPSTIGQSVKFTATVKPATSGTPTGTVMFKNGTKTLGTGTLTDGITTFQTSTLTHGTHSISAEYEGSTDYLGSTSPALTQKVN